MRSLSIGLSTEERAAASARKSIARTGRWSAPSTSPRPTNRRGPTSGFGIKPWFNYFQKVAAFPQMTMPGDQVDEMIDVINEAGAGVIGRPERARAQVQRLWDQSGGFGCMLQMGHEWANPAATKRSAELFAAEVIPHFQGQAQPTLDAAERASDVQGGPGGDADERHRAHDQEVRGREGQLGRRRVSGYVTPIGGTVSQPDTRPSVGG